MPSDSYQPQLLAVRWQTNCSNSSKLVPPSTVYLSGIKNDEWYLPHPSKLLYFQQFCSVAPAVNGTIIWCNSKNDDDNDEDGNDYNYDHVTLLKVFIMDVIIFY